MLSLSLVQLPFPSLSYFPIPEYFRAMEIWHRDILGAEYTIPNVGIWEVPSWVTWTKAAIQAALIQRYSDFQVNTIDLSRTYFDSEAVIEGLKKYPETDVYCFSPLTQNSELASKTANILRSNGRIVVAGGVIAKYLNSSDFDSIFIGRIESQYDGFIDWLSSLLDLPKSNLVISECSHSGNLEYRWAPDYYLTDINYLRTFTNHGCPFKCTFCADRLSGSSQVSPNLLKSDIEALTDVFSKRAVLYIGDLTFGTSPSSIVNLKRALSHLQMQKQKCYRLIVQTNASLITPQFISELKELGVVLVEMGIESANAKTVRSTEKFRPSTRWLEDKIDMLLDSGLKVSGNIIVGLPHDTEEEYQETESFIHKWRDKLWFNIYGFVPYPGTPIYSELLSKGRISNWNLDEWCEGSPFVFEPYYISTAKAYDYFLKIVSAVPSAQLQRFSLE